MHRLISNLLSSLLALAVGLALGGIVCLCVGENPVEVYIVLFNGAFGSLTSLGDTLFNATPLILTGLGVSWALHAGLFNIGAEGQMAMGGITMYAVAHLLETWPPSLAISIACVAGFFVSGCWAAIAAAIKIYRGSHEVLSTILLNFIAYGLLAFSVVKVFRDKLSQAPESIVLPLSLKIGPLSALGGHSALNWTLAISVLIALVTHFILTQTVFGFSQRMVGSAPRVATIAGHATRLQLLMAMFISGGLCGLAAINDIFGYSLRLKEGFTAGAGFIGIAVALMGRLNAFGIIVSAILFGALQKGSLALDIETEHITRDIALVIQAAIILTVVSENGIRKLFFAARSRFATGDSK